MKGVLQVPFQQTLLVWFVDLIALRNLPVNVKENENYNSFNDRLCNCILFLNGIIVVVIIVIAKKITLEEKMYRLFYFIVNGHNISLK